MSVPALGSLLSSAWTRGWHELCLNSIAFVLYAACSRRLTAPAKACVLLLYGAAAAYAVATGMDLVHDLVWSLIGLAYFAGLTVLIEVTVRAFPNGVPSQFALAAVLAFLFIFVPAALPEAGGVLVQLLGWEMALAAYSYCVDAAKGKRTTFGSCAFFILVNPMLVYPERGAFTGPPAANGSALARGGAGVLASSLKHVVFDALAIFPWLAPVRVSAIRSVAAYLRFVLHYGLRLIAGYAGHSSRASMQIAWMRVLGHPIPERYRYPLLAHSPLEFWRRWNTYVGSWARRYVFVPSSLWLKRRIGGHTSTVTAVIVTFVVIGLVHDSIWIARASTLNFSTTAVFASQACALLVWQGMAQAIKRARGRSAAPASTGLIRLLGCAGLIHLLMLTLEQSMPAENYAVTSDSPAAAVVASVTSDVR
jgi:hypothetical protein